MPAEVKQKVCLIVIDGWGNSTKKEGNAILNANTPVMDRICAGNACEVEASGLHVGLPDGLMGNSEVGHLNIGAGRVVYQDIVRIDLSCTSGKIASLENFVAACTNAKSKSGRLHLLGLVSDGGVHSHINHLYALLKGAKQNGVPKTFVQFFADGRDTSPTSGVGFVQNVIDFVKKEGYGELATVVGRYYAMDRDKRWERIQVAYDGLVAGKGEKATTDTLIDIMKRKYKTQREGTTELETDEFLKPMILSEEGRIKDNDTLIFIDYRADRMREITETFGLTRHFTSDVPHPKGLHVSTMTQYNKEFPFPMLFPHVSHKNVLAEWLEAQGLTQFHTAETEKYAHVTFFFNGGVEKAFAHEERALVPSPKVATYDLQPRMSAEGVADKMIEVISKKVHPFVMCNFAPPDMVGHTGVYEATLKGVEVTDESIGRIEKACKEHGYTMMVTSDHGNAEQMLDEKGGKHTAHTCNKVPFTSSGARKLKKILPDRNPGLRDVATTVLAEMGLPIPPEMDGVSLLE